MTKRRLSWSKSLRQVAAFAAGLLLLHAAPPVWAAGKKVSAKPAHSRPARKAVHRVVRPALPAQEFGPADLIDDGPDGLHGQASFYGRGFHGRKTSTGERFDSRQSTAASNRFPLGTLLAVRREDKDLCAVVKVNDRMHGKHRRRIIDVSRSVAESLDMIRSGVVFVRVAPLPAGWRESDPGACQAAFKTPLAEQPYGQPPKWPETTFGNGG